jgi:hypothetical protein
MPSIAHLVWSEPISKKRSLCGKREGNEESRKTVPERIVTTSADNQSHHSRRSSRCRRDSIGCASCLPDLSRDDKLADSLRWLRLVIQLA